MTLGLATFCRDTEPLACDWTPDLTGVHDAGQCVGDGQTGRSYEARIINDDAPRSAVQLITYVTENDGEYRVCLLALWCTWDTSGITWRAERTWAMRDSWPTRQAAVFVANECAWEMASTYGRLAMALGQFSHETFSPVLGWDGQPFEGES